LTRIVTNKLLNSPTKRVIENCKNDFRASDGPNTSSFINLDDLGIPYDSHYVSRIVLPANSEDVLLNYSLSDSVTFLLIKVTYNGNYDVPNEDSYDPYYNFEPNTYNINYYFEDNTGITYPIGRLLILSGSYNNKVKKIYLNNPLDYDVVLDVLHADINSVSSIPPSSAITFTNLYYSDVITDNVSCVPSGYTTTTTTLGTTTTTTFLPTTTTTSTTLIKELMRIIKTTENGDYKSGYIRYTSSGETFGLFDYYKDNEWIFAGEDNYFVDFTDLTGVEKIRFYFIENDTYYGVLKDDSYDPIEHNTGLYFVDVTTDAINIPAISGITIPTTTTTTTTINVNDNFLFTGSTEFIISQYTQTISGYTIDKYVIPYNIIMSITKNVSLDIIYISTTTIYYTLKFLTDLNCNTAYSRMMFVYNSYLYNDCSYLTESAIFDNGNIIVY